MNPTFQGAAQRAAIPDRPIGRAGENAELLDFLRVSVTSVVNFESFERGGDTLERETTIRRMHPQYRAEANKFSSPELE